jgi:hypothetical protein
VGFLEEPCQLSNNFAAFAEPSPNTEAEIRKFSDPSLPQPHQKTAHNSIRNEALNFREYWQWHSKSQQISTLFIAPAEESLNA